MIADAVLGWVVSLLHGLLGLLPHISTPSWLNVDGPMSTVFTYAGSMGAWFPTSFALAVVATVFATWAIGFGIKLVRIVLSFFTLGGGSAA